MQGKTTCLICIGLILILVGGFFVIGGIALTLNPNYHFPDPVLGPIIFVGLFGVVFLVGLLLFVTQLRAGRAWNITIDVVKSHKSITIDELSREVQMAPSKVKKILFSAISAGAIKGSIKDDAFVKEEPRPIEPSAPTIPVTTPVQADTVKVLVICPYCGAKTEQGLANCQKCGADL